MEHIARTSLFFSEMTSSIEKTLIDFENGLYAQHNNSIILEYFPYYRYYVLFSLVYVTIVYIIVRVIYKDFFFVLLLRKYYFLFVAINKKYIYINKLYLLPEIKNILKNSKSIFLELFDKGIIERFGPYGVVTQLNFFFKYVQKYQTGYIYHYIGYLYSLLIIFLIVLLWLY